MPPLIIIFAKAPREGAVKTRMLPWLDPKQAAALHQAMVRDTLDSLQSIEGVELHTDIDTDAWKDVPVPRRLQVQGDLGARMRAALTDGLARGHSHVLITGSDAPTLPAAYLLELLASTADVALGPTEDGGYYAIACSRTHPDMFRDVPWSTPRALQQTIASAKDCGLTVALGRTWFDVDEPLDLQRLAGAPHTCAFLKNMNQLKVGDAAPEITLTASDGKPFGLSALRGSAIVLFFYPKANTPGCTTEACEFSAQNGDFTRKKAVVVGISPDAPKPQQAFRTKFGFPYTLLCDTEHKVAEAYGVWKEKSLYGRKYMGIERSTFVIAPDGRIAAIYHKVKPAGHAAQVLAEL